MQPQILLDELDKQGGPAELSSPQVEALLATGLVEVRPRADGLWQVLPNGKVGAVQIDDLQVQVRPKEKIGLARLLFLLGYAADPGFRPEMVVGVEEHDLWPALAESLARLAERATQRGVLQGYRKVEEATRTVRGRIRIGDQISRRPGQMLPLEVTYDEFTTDIPENQILRAAIHRMLGIPRLSGEARSRLAHIDGRLADVTWLHPGISLPTWSQTRLNQHYSPALRLAELVLMNASAEAGPGDIRVAAFVVDMARVFEDFLATALAESLRRYSGKTSFQYPTHLDEPATGAKPAIAMKIDIVHSVNDHPRVIFDAKYKAATSQDRYPNADHYQMLAYCTALKLPTAWLVYAGPGKPQRRQIRNAKIEVIEYPINVGSDPEVLLQSIDRLVDRAWRRAQHPHRAMVA